MLLSLCRRRCRAPQAWKSDLECLQFVLTVKPMLQDLAGITAGGGGGSGGDAGGILPDAAEWDAIERICVLLEKFRCESDFIRNLCKVTDLTDPRIQWTRSNKNTITYPPMTKQGPWRWRRCSALGTQLGRGKQ